MQYPYYFYLICSNFTAKYYMTASSNAKYVFNYSFIVFTNDSVFGYVLAIIK